MKAATFPDQRTGPLTGDELRALRLVGEASPAPLLFTQVADTHDTDVWLGLEMLRARGWVRLRGWPDMSRMAWALTVTGTREAASWRAMRGALCGGAA
jgi:hypothetical protein